MREKKRESSHVQGRAISLMEMSHVMLKYPEVYTDLVFTSVPTMPLELRAGVDTEVEVDVDMDGGVFFFLK